MIRTERSSFIPAPVAVRYTLPPRLRRGTRHTGAPPFLASLRRAPVRHPEGASGRCSLAARSHGPRKAPERVGSPAGAQEGVHRHAPVARLRESPRGYPKHMFGKRGRTRTVPQHGKAVSSEVTSGCPKRSEGGFPVGTRTITAFHAESKRNRASRTEPGMEQESTKEAPPPTSGDDASFVRAGSAEKLSLPRRTQPESAHARGRHQPDRE